MYQIISILTPMVKPNQMYWEEGILVCRMKELLDNSVCIYVYMCVYVCILPIDNVRLFIDPEFQK